MKIHNKLTSKTLNLLLIIILVLILGVSTALAQSAHRPTHFGFETSIGVNGILPEASNTLKLRAMSRGVSGGFVVGNSLLKARVRIAGIYLPTCHSQSSGKVFDSEALVNLYPLEFLRTHKNILDIYFTTGFRFAHVQLGFEDGKEFTSSPTQKGKVLSQVSGFGGEYRIPGQNKFVYLFAEVVFANPVHSASSSSAFSNVWTNKSASTSIGVRFGSFRHRTQTIRQ